MLSYQAQAVKDWLLAYRAAEEEINVRFEKIRILETRIKTAGAVEISDMPKAHGSSADKLTEYLIRKEQLSEECSKLLMQHEKDKEAVVSLFCYLTPVQRKIIYYKYFVGLEWADIYEHIFYVHVDRNTTEGNTMRKRASRLHDSALETLAVNWASKKSS